MTKYLQRFDHENCKFETLLSFNKGEKLIEPAIIKNPKKSMVQKSLAGPVLSIKTYKDTDDLKKELKNENPLSFSIFSQDPIF